MEYYAFTDESNFTQGRFRSIAAFTLPGNSCNHIEAKLRAILASSDVIEFKWEKLRTAKDRFCAEKIINLVIDKLMNCDLRVDVLIWDIQDSRHAVFKRDDVANFERMFYHLLRNALKRREYGARWRVFPDQNAAIDWGTVHDCLASAGQRRDLIENTLFGDFVSDPHFHIAAFEEADSKLFPQCQVADLFAGMGAFSRSNYDGFVQWRNEHRKGPTLFEEGGGDFSKSEYMRYEIIDNFSSSCKKRKFGVSIDSNRCLSTFNPNNPINFWHYQPQHDLDKAPTKGS